MIGVEILAAALIAVNLYDTIITDYILRRGGRERNPLMRALYNRSRSGFYVIKNLLVFGVIAFFVFGQVAEGSVIVVLSAGILIIGGACLNNTIILLTTDSNEEEINQPLR